MKNRYWVLVGLLVFGIYGYLNAEPHWNSQTTYMSQDDGDSMRPFRVVVGTIAVQVYNATTTAVPQRTAYNSVDRLVVIQNTRPFDLFCATSSSGFSATTGNRWKIYSTTYTGDAYIFNTYAAPAQIWCLFDPAQGNTAVEIVGYTTFDSGD